MVETYLGIWGFGSRPIVATPGVPADRLQILRDAFNKMFKDPEFQEELRKRNWEVEFVAGEELQSLAKDVVNQPPDVAAGLKRVLSQ